MNVINDRKPLSGIQRLLEAGLMLCCASAVFLLLALFSFDPADPGFSQTARGAIVKNMTGAAGAWLADLLFFLFGMQAFLVPFAVAFLGWYSFKRYHRFREIDFLALSLRLFGGLLLIMGFAGLASLNFDDFYFFSSGGVLGDVISSVMLPLFSVLGSVLLLLSFLAVGFTLATGISWLAVVDNTGTLLIWCFEKTVLRPLALYKGGDAPNLEEKPLKAEQSPAIQLDDIREERVADLEKIERTLKVEDLAPVEHDDLLEDETLLDQDDDYDAAVDDRLTALASAPDPVTTMATGNVVKIVETQASITPLPSIALLDRPDKNLNPISQEELEQVSRLVELKLLDFGIEANVVGVFPGPVIPVLNWTWHPA